MPNRDGENLRMKLTSQTILQSNLANLVGTDNTPSSEKFRRQGFVHYWELFTSFETE